MATLATNTATLADLSKQLDPDGSLAAVIEILNETNEVTQDIPWKEGNTQTGERTTIRTGLPSVYYRLINQAVSVSKAQTEQVDEACAMLEAWCEVDVKLAALNGNTAQYRMSQAAPFVEAMGQQFVSTLLYGNQDTAPETFTGLHPRFSDLSAANAENIINCDASPTAGVTSIWLICWGDNTVHGIYPKGSSAGLKHIDHGEVTVDGASGSYGSAGQRIRVLQDQFTWDVGLVVRDWRYVARAANIDVSSLDSFSGAADLSVAMAKMTHALPNLNGRCAFYANRTALQALDIQGLATVRGHVPAASGDVGNAFTTTAYGAGSYANYQGRPVLDFRGIPIRRVDQILTSEDTIS